MNKYERIKFEVERDEALFLMIFGIVFIVFGIIEIAMFNELAQIFAT